MAMSIDTLIQNISGQVLYRQNDAYSYTFDAQNEVAGLSQTTDPRFVNYITPPDTTELDLDLPPTLSSTPGKALIDAIAADLTRYFNKFFPNISENYLLWLTALKNAIDDGVPLTLNNEALNEQRQTLDKADGVRKSRAIRAAFATKGYDKVPGQMVGMVIDEADMRTEKLIAGAIESANQSVQAELAGYKSLISTALATADARVAAVRAMTALISTAADVYESEVAKYSALVKARAAAAEAALAYYRAELRLDEMNTAIYKTNVGWNVQRFSTDSSLFFRNEDAQVQAAIASAEQSAKIAQAAFSALNTISNASTVGFS